MFDEKRLRAAMVIADKSVKELCEILDIAPSTFYRKCTNDGDFSRKEIDILANLLSLDNEARNAIFFAD